MSREQLKKLTEALTMLSELEDKNPEELSVDKQKEILKGFLKEFPDYKNPFVFGDLVISNPEKLKYSFPSEDRPGVVLETYTGIDKWSRKKHNENVCLQDTMIAVVDPDNGEVMFYKVDSRYLIKID